MSPRPDEDEEEFMDRCTEDGEYSESECEIIWQESAMPTEQVVHKTREGQQNGTEFILSDASVDRMGDIIEVGGWQLAAFRKNPIALFGHSSSFPIGTWKNVRVEGNALRGNLELAPEGTSERIDEIRRLLAANILRAVSVGFKPLKYEPLDPDEPWEGQRFLEQELVETSVVSVPANANALAVAKGLNISAETISLVFAKQGNRNETVTRGGRRAEQGKDHRSSGKGRAMTLAQRIVDVESKITGYRAELDDHLEHLNDDNVSDADMDKTNDLTGKIAQHTKHHASLIEAEKRLAKNTEANGSGNGSSNGSTRSRALSTTVLETDHGDVKAPAIILARHKNVDLLEHYVRAATVAIRAKDWGRSLEETRLKIATMHPQYGEDDTKTACDLIVRAASAPAMTTVTGWAAELVQPRFEAMLPLLMPKAILSRLAARGLTLDFAGAGKINIPARSRTPTIAGSFVGEGLPIPVRQGAFTTTALTPKKLAVISVWTREMELYSTPAIEGVIREAIQEDTAVAVDSVLIDANAATVIRPAGLLNGVTVTTATAGGGIAAIVGDLKSLIGAITTATYGNVRGLVLLMNPAEVLSASLANVNGIFPFAAGIGAGNLAGIPFIDSATVPAKTMILVDAADFVIVGGGAPTFAASDQATLHMEDTAPAELVAAGSPGVVAAPQRSLFQTDSLALRMTLPLNWVQRRPGTVAWTQTVTW